MAYHRTEDPGKQTHAQEDHGSAPPAEHGVQSGVLRVRRVIENPDRVTDPVRRLTTTPLTVYLPRITFGLVGLGLIGLSLSDSVFSYLVSSGVNKLPLIGDVGFIFGPIFIALVAAMEPKGLPRPAVQHSAPRSTQWVSLSAPYVPLVLATVLLAGQVAVGRRLTVSKYLLHS